MSTNSWWLEECPARDAGLRHAHWDQCTPEAHPGEDSGHMLNQCCHCRAIHGGIIEPVAEMPAGLADHLYIFTITGKCVRCGRTQDAHPAILKVTAPGECQVDHASITAAHLIGDGGLEWRRCPACNRMIEPKMATGAPVGPKWGRGRGDLIERAVRRLVFVRYVFDREGREP